MTRVRPQSSPDVQIKRNRRSQNQIQHKDNRGRYNAIVVKVYYTGNKTLAHRLVPARVSTVASTEFVTVARRARAMVVQSCEDAKRLSCV